MYSDRGGVRVRGSDRVAGLMDSKDPLRQDFRFMSWHLRDIKTSLGYLNFVMTWIAIELTVISVIVCTGRLS